MENRRLTMKNPGGRNYRLTCAVDTADLRVDMGREYPTLLGNKIDVIGQLEDLHPLEWYLENIKKLPFDQKESQVNGCLPINTR